MNRWMIVMALVVVSLGTGVRGEDIVTLKTGEVLHGQVVKQADGVITFKHPVLGVLKIKQDQTVSAMTAEQAKIEAEAAQKAEAEKTAQAEAAKQLFPDWKSQLEAGFSGAKGNSDAMNIYLRFASKREKDEQRTKVFAQYFMTESDGNRTQNEASAGVTQDWFLGDSPWFVFADARGDYDQFQSWEYRVAGHGGMGYQFIKDETFDLSGRVGAGALKEFHSPNEDVRPEALAGVDFSWNINKRQTLNFSNYIYPDLDEIGEFRNVSTADWTMKIDQMDGLSLKFGLTNEYESNAPAPTKKNDFKYFGALVFGF